LLHVFDGSPEAKKAQSPQKNLGIFDINEMINVLFKDESSDQGFLEDVSIPVVCLKNESSEPELTVVSEGVELKVSFTITPVDAKANADEAMSSIYEKFPSSNAYKCIRAAVLAVARAPINISENAPHLTATIHYVVEGSQVAVSVCVDLMTDFLVQIDQLFLEACLLVDERLCETQACLLDCLHQVHSNLQHKLDSADDGLTKKIHSVMQRLAPYISMLCRLAYPLVCTAVAVGSHPMLTNLYPYTLEPVVNRLLNIHDGLQKSTLVGPLVTSATQKALIVYDKTRTMYELIDKQKRQQYDRKVIADDGKV